MENKKAEEKKLHENHQTEQSSKIKSQDPKTTVHENDIAKDGSTAIEQKKRSADNDTIGIP